MLSREKSLRKREKSIMKNFTKKEIDKHAELINKLEKDKKRLEKQIKDLKTDLQEYMNGSDLEELDTSKFLISYTKFHQNRLDTNRLKEEKPKIYSDYLKEISSSRFSIKEK